MFSWEQVTRASTVPEQLSGFLSQHEIVFMCAITDQVFTLVLIIRTIWSRTFNIQNWDRNIPISNNITKPQAFPCSNENWNNTFFYLELSLIPYNSCELSQAPLLFLAYLQPHSLLFWASWDPFRNKLFEPKACVSPCFGAAQAKTNYSFAGLYRLILNTSSQLINTCL